MDKARAVKMLVRWCALVYVGGEGVGVLGLLEILITDCKIVTIKALQYNSEGF